MIVVAFICPLNLSTFDPYRVIALTGVFPTTVNGGYNHDPEIPLTFQCEATPTIYLPAALSDESNMVSKRLKYFCERMLLLAPLGLSGVCWFIFL
jgi:hypothetical protein